MNSGNAAIYSKRRRALSDQLDNASVVLSAYTQMQASNDMAHRFIQEANFLYFTGISFPDWKLIIDGENNKSWLVAPEVSDTHQLFDGSLSLEDAKMLSGVDDVLSSGEAHTLLHNAATQGSVVYTLGDDPHANYYDFSLNPAPNQLRKELEGIFTEVRDVRPFASKLRAIKQPEEIKHVQAAVNLTTETFEAVQRQLSSYTHEYQIEAEFNRAFRATGAEGHAYDPIVASGAHACTLHYGANNDTLPENGLVLLDIGARINGYAADITRTYAIGTPTERQKAVHAAVEKAQATIIGSIKPGLSFKDYNDMVDATMKEALLQLGLIDSFDDTDGYRNYFPHAISHGLGLDVHESLGGFGEFKPGMIFTIEPGIYIPKEGIGVRIEDNILVTDTGHQNLSGHLPTGL